MMSRQRRLARVGRTMIEPGKRAYALCFTFDVKTVGLLRVGDSTRGQYVSLRIADALVRALKHPKSFSTADV
jgi:hypothetical protein